MIRICHMFPFRNWYTAISEKVSLQALKNWDETVVKSMSYSSKRNLRKTTWLNFSIFQYTFHKDILKNMSIITINSVDIIFRGKNPPQPPQNHIFCKQKCSASSYIATINQSRLSCKLCYKRKGRTTEFDAMLGFVFLTGVCINFFWNYIEVELRKDKMSYAGSLIKHSPDNMHHVLLNGN